MTDAIYIAGPLNADACGYLKNVFSMNEIASGVEDFGAAVYIPANDLVYGIFRGDREYYHYVANSMEWLIRSDAVFLCPGWEKSNGTNEEIKMAEHLGIPVFDDWSCLDNFLHRPKILAIVGESGTGKTTAAEYIENEYEIGMIKSYTDRSPRPGDTSHTFLSKEEFDEIDHKDMIVYTEFGENRYCCKHEDVWALNTYVLDERGYMELKLAYKTDYRIEGLRLHRNIDDRIDAVGQERVKRDKHKFVLPDYCFNYVYHNDSSLCKLQCYLDIIMEGFDDLPER